MYCIHMKLTHSILKLNNSKAIGERGPKKGLYIYVDLLKLIQKERKKKTTEV
jgi:hypothetical protein